MLKYAIFVVSIEKRWAGMFSREFLHKGKSYIIKLDMLKLKMAAKDASYTFTMSIGPADEKEERSQTVVTLDELNSIGGNRFVRLDSRYFLPEGGRPFKLVAGLQY